MRRNATSSSSWTLYVILDRDAAGARDLRMLAGQVIRGGADALQLRAKGATARQLIAEARRLLPVTRAARVPLIINDRADVARAVGADGVHLGQDDLPVHAARAILGSGRLIGQSTHSLRQALAAKRAGADYVGFGPIFQTPTKPDYPRVGLRLIRTVVSRIDLPTVCIGGIDGANIPDVLAAGARCVAVVRAVCSAKHPEQATRVLKRLLLAHQDLPGAQSAQSG
jgi:thiamine-phosphate pyrophosphorylase